MRKLICIVLIMITSFSLFATTAPFGLEWGMNEKEIRDCCYLIDRTSFYGVAYLEVIPPMSRADMDTVELFVSDKGLYQILCYMDASYFEAMYRNLNLVYGQGSYEETYTTKSTSWESTYYSIGLHLNKNAISLILSYNLNDKGREKYLKPDTYGL